jgi:hypothetical protein
MRLGGLTRPEVLPLGEPSERSKQLPKPAANAACKGQHAGTESLRFINAQ